MRISCHIFYFCTYLTFLTLSMILQAVVVFLIIKETEGSGAAVRLSAQFLTLWVTQKAARVLDSSPKTESIIQCY
jgi:hypothetical protein